MPNITLVDDLGNPLRFSPAIVGYQLPITPLPDVLMIDNFNGTVIDTVSRWQSPVLAGTGTMTQASGNLVTTLGTTASNAAAISTIENFEPSIGAITAGALIQTEASPSINTNRCFWLLYPSRKFHSCYSSTRRLCLGVRYQWQLRCEHL